MSHNVLIRSKIIWNHTLITADLKIILFEASGEKNGKTGCFAGCKEKKEKTGQIAA
ncbi:hypothetical protein KDD30_07235 [Photobacterium sp. GJ3]|uniref:hypothetical protein n=1 Tax=Photobacterium sp. GJ3 TaxID=2829502 RepID=UPI001B8CDF27|nr:hypothetical protein [Photobacterium sp. GJ3]QUJ68867.1 hypothetical protein KDD30_07235 [Photobacterium sp. GJ3]